MSQEIITLENVAFAYDPEVPILHDVNLSIKHGEYVGLIGPNGGGKTTLLKLVMGFLQPDQGKIKVFGKSPKEVREKIAYVPQAMPFDRQFPISVIELVLSGRLSHLPWYGIYPKEDRIAALEALEKVGIAHLAKRQFGTLSGGQAQRALIARALVSNPDLLLLDEPTAGVDLKAEEGIYELLKSFEGNITMLMVTHDLNTIISDVERVLCVQNTVIPLKAEKVCEHFALGLYHTPLQENSK